jgi:penicillin-insensitive murein endopeptidase
MSCPKDSVGCKPQGAPKPKDGTGCGEELAYWLGPEPWTPKKRDPNAPPVKPPPPLTLSGLPDDCRNVIAAE